MSNTPTPAPNQSKNDNGKVALEYAGKAGGMALTTTQKILGLWRWFVGFLGLMLIYNPTTFLNEVSYFYWVTKHPGYTTEPSLSITTTGWLQAAALILAIIVISYAYKKIARRPWISISVSIFVGFLLMAAYSSGILDVNSWRGVVVGVYGVFSIVLGFMLNRLRLDRHISGTYGTDEQDVVEVDFED